MASSAIAVVFVAIMSTWLRVDDHRQAAPDPLDELHVLQASLGWNRPRTRSRAWVSF